jgi:hypothetical protein
MCLNAFHLNIKLFLVLTKHHAIKQYVALDGGALSKLPPGKEPQYPMDRRLGGLQSQSDSSS